MPKILLSMLFAACLWLLGFLWFLSQLPTATPLLSAPTADAVVILTGGRGRLSYGLKLLDIGKGKQLFVSGVHINSSKNDVFQTENTELSAIYNRLKNRITLGKQAQDTIGNAHEVASWVKQYGYNSILLVTNHYHIPRSMREFNYTLPDTTITPIAVIDDKFQTANWWQNQDAVLLLINEYQKYLASIIWHIVIDIINQDGHQNTLLNQI